MYTISEVGEEGLLASRDLMPFELSLYETFILILTSFLLILRSF